MGRPLHRAVRDPAVRLRDIAPHDRRLRFALPGRVKDPAVSLEPLGHDRQHAFGESAQPGDNPGGSTRVWRTLIAAEPNHSAIVPLPGWRCIRIWRPRISHSFLTDWPDDAGPGRTVWTSGGP